MRSRIAYRLLAVLALLLGLNSVINAGEFCSAPPFNGVVDGSIDYTTTVPALDPFPTQITIDTDCTFQNFTGANPLTATLNFQTNDPSIYLITFNNVIFTGNMACANVDHRIWFVNGSDYGSKNNCQDLFIPVEAIDKQNPPGVTTVGIGDPFTYTLTIPVLYDPVTGTYINNAGSANDLHSIHVVDDLNESAADLTLVGVPTVTWRGTGAPVAHTFTNVGGLLTFDIDPGVIIPAGDQIDIRITVVADATNIPGTQFINTARWSFGRLIDIDGVPTYFDPLPGENGVTDPLTIGAPNLVVDKTSSSTVMNMGTLATFYIDVRNTGNTNAWNATIVDLLPDTPTAGMCNYDPTASVTAQVFAADGVTPVSGVLTPGVDYSVNYTASPTCELDITMLSSSAVIGPGQRLIISYQSRLDADTSADGATLTNYAGTTQWFSGAAGFPRTTFNRTITDGTPAVIDHEDSYTVTTALSGYFFQKTVENRTSGQSPATTAAPNDTLRYRIRFINVDETITNLNINDVIDTTYFQMNTFSMVSIPGNATYSYNPTTGLLQITGNGAPLSVPSAGELVIEFDITLATGLANGTIVDNQAVATDPSIGTVLSDDPNRNGIDDPTVPGGEDPARVTIVASPLFQIYKISDDLTGSATELLAGDTLRYTITVKNIGNEDATNAFIRDLIPANTTYVANSTTLNGIAVADPSLGVAPLETGILINAPENTTPGYMRADASSTTTNVATIVFDVTINSGVLAGTIISNQAFLNALGLDGTPTPEQPSDDPATIVLNDPTRDIIGNLPLVDSVKTVEILVDNGSVGVVDPGDILRYTIITTNYGAVPATGVRLVDTVPVNTTYVADSVFLNAIPVGQPDGGVSPLIAGIDISSSNLTPPIPTGGNGGILSPGGVATVVFEVQVDAGVPSGTVISNQGTVYDNELPNEPTDADGNDSNGDQPTLITVGNAQQLAITKSVSVVGGGIALYNSQLEYVVTVTNIGLVPATNVIILDDLDVPVAGQMTYVPGSGTLNGSPVGVSYTAPVITADYSTTYGDLQPGATVTLRFRVDLDSALTIGTTVTNTATVYWNAMTQNASASVSIQIGAMPGVGVLNGQVWHDANFDNVYNSGEQVLAGWTVELYRNGAIVGSVLTDASGLYQITGVAANNLNGDVYELRFIAPGAGSNTALLGYADSTFTNGLQRISDIMVDPGTTLQNLNLPIEPNGVVYDSVLRVPITGATLTMMNAVSNLSLPGSCFDDAAQQGQVTLPYGYYKFDINFSQPECQAGGTYYISVTPPAGNFVTGESTIIPPATNLATAAYSVPVCAGDAVPATVNNCEAQAFETAPPTSIAAGTPGTVYYLHLTLDNNAVPRESQIFNNHIPLDPDLGLAVNISKVSSLVNVTRGQMLPYTITVNNTLASPLTGITVTDFIPAGFKYVAGSARLDGVPVEPVINGLQLDWPIASIAVDTRYTIKLLLVVGSGVQEGEYINRAQIFSAITNGSVSEQARATVRVVPDPTFDCSDVIGKVYDDKNLNGEQDGNEPGLQGVRLATAQGLLVTTDQHGRFHITCAVVPNEQRGSNFILKLDERTLPTGYRVMSENPRVQRVTRGKMIKYNFATTIHRVVRIDVADGVFEKGSDTIRPQWLTRVDLLVEELRKAPSILRLTYLGDVEEKGLVNDRLEALHDLIESKWANVDSYKLVIEQEIFWRNGGPAGGDGLD